MHDYPTNDHGRHRWTARSTLHLVGAMRDFWASDLNRAAIDLIDPQPGMTVLDVGAGLGPATIEAAPRVEPGGRVIAIDPASTMRRVLSLRRLWQRSRRAIAVRRGSAEDLPVAPASVDAVVAVNAAHHFDDVERATADLARVLKPGGRVLLIDEDFSNSRHPYHQPGETEMPEPVDAANIVRLLSAAGLTVTRQDHHPIAGVTATIISAIASRGRPEADAEQPHKEGPS